MSTDGKIAGMSWENRISTGQAVIIMLMTVLGTVGVFYHYGSDNGRLLADQAAAIQTAGQELHNAIAFETAQRTAQETLIRTETTAAITHLSDKLDATATLNDRNLKDLALKIVELQQGVQRLTEASTPTSGGHSR